MSRRSKVRITSREKSELQRLNRNAKAKQNRISKNFGVDTGVNVKSLKDLQSMTRKEVNEYKSQLQSFTNRHNQNYQFVKNENNVVMSKKEIAEIERSVKRINRIKEREQKKIENKTFTHRGKATPTTVGQQRGLMRDPRYQDNNPVRFNFDKLRNRSEVNQFKVTELIMFNFLFSTIYLTTNLV